MKSRKEKRKKARESDYLVKQRQSHQQSSSHLQIEDREPTEQNIKYRDSSLDQHTSQGVVKAEQDEMSEE